MTLENVNPIWGMTTPEFESSPNISTHRGESLILPGYPNTVLHMPYNPSQNMAGVDFPSSILASSYSRDSIDAGRYYGMPEYTGRANLAMLRRWQKLSRSAESVSNIVNLIFTDIAANAVVGTK